MCYNEKGVQPATDFFLLVVFFYLYSLILIDIDIAVTHLGALVMG